MSIAMAATNLFRDKQNDTQTHTSAEWSNSHVLEEVKCDIEL